MQCRLILFILILSVITKTKCCQGITLKGLPCKIKIENNFNFCFFHKEQLTVKPSTTKCCKATTKSGSPCKKKLSISSLSDFCVFHKSKGLVVTKTDVIGDQQTPAPAVMDFVLPKTLLSTKLDIEPASNSGFIISKAKDMFLGVNDNKTVRLNSKKKFKKKSSSDEDSDEIFICAADTGTQPDEATDEDIYEFVRKWKEGSLPTKKDK